MKKLSLFILFLALGQFTKAATTYLNLTCIIEGYHLGSGQMTAAAFNEGCAWAVPNLTDRVQIQLRKKTPPYAIVAQAIGNLYSTGLTNTIPLSHANLVSDSYYLVVKNTRNAVEVWSAQPVQFTISSTTTYDFSKDPASAYGNNMKKVGGVATGYPLGVWAFYSGDVNSDGNIDLLDAAKMEYDVLHFAYGCVKTDLNGDGNVDLLDMAIFESNPLGAFIGVIHP
ncbi:MAG: hypothetical protein ABI851_11085 [Saprospiraceae bacterium]